MAETGGVPMTRQEIAAFAQKLEEWGQGLTAKEQAFLDDILARWVVGGQDEVQGFMSTPLREPGIVVDSSIAGTWDDFFRGGTQGRFSGAVLSGNSSWGDPHV